MFVLGRWQRSPYDRVVMLQAPIRTLRTHVSVSPLARSLPLPLPLSLSLSLSLFSVSLAKAHELTAAAGARWLHIHAPAVASEEAFCRRQASGPFAATSEQAPPATVREDLHLLRDLPNRQVRQLGI